MNKTLEKNIKTKEQKRKDRILQKEIRKMTGYSRIGLKNV